MSEAAELIKNRFLGFLLWQSILCTSIFILSKSLLLSPFTIRPFFPSLFGCLLFFCFHLSMLLFAVSLHAVATPQWCRPASPMELALGLLRLVVASSSPNVDFRCRVRASLGIVLLVSASAVSGFVSVASVVGSSYTGSFIGLVSRVGMSGFNTGLIYGFYCTFKRRLVLTFPVVQRPPFFSFKMGLPSSARQGLNISGASYVLSAIFVVLLQNGSKPVVARGLLSEQFVLFIGNFMVILCWELILHLHKVLHTKRSVFAPPKGSAAVETNSNELLLTALEESPPRSLLQYLAYLDLSMVCLSNIDSWRRAAFYEETGETYKRVVAVCLGPLEQLASKLGEGLASSADSFPNLSHQLYSPEDIRHNPEYLELFNDFQLYAWCAQAVASLEVSSHKEDRFGVAQLSGSHAAVMSTLLSCLLAVETFTGKKINHLQSPNHTLDPTGIKWATNSTARREISIAMNKRRGSSSHLKCYALADILKNSIHCIVSEFHEEMLAGAKSGILERDWVTSSKPVYGSRDLVLKLSLFLKFSG